jgi:hypothetical protein
MITFPTSQIQNTDLSRRPLIRHGGARANARLRSQLAHPSSLLKADTYVRNGLFMRGNVVDQRVQWRRLPSRASSAALKSP